MATLACMVLHNVCIDRGDTISKKMNLTVDPVTNQRQDRQQICELLQITSCEKNRDEFSLRADHGRPAVNDVPLTHPLPRFSRHLDFPCSL